jgi:hypothetical protein
MIIYYSLKSIICQAEQAEEFMQTASFLSIFSKKENALISYFENIPLIFTVKKR